MVEVKFSTIFFNIDNPKIVNVNCIIMIYYQKPNVFSVSSKFFMSVNSILRGL